jgi:hypothetical protein
LNQYFCGLLTALRAEEVAQIKRYVNAIDVEDMAEATAVTINARTKIQQLKKWVEELQRISGEVAELFPVAPSLLLSMNEASADDVPQTLAAVVWHEEVESAIQPKQTSNTAIDSEDVIAWLVTQPNANGTLYLENVVRQYMGALRTTPAKLDTPAVMDAGSVFACQTPDDLNAYWEVCKAAPNYKQINSNTPFSAALSCYMRYLQHLTDGVQADESVKNYGAQPEPEVVAIVSTSQSSCEFRRVDFNYPERRAQIEAVQTYSQPDHTISYVLSKQTLDPAVIEQLTDVLSAHFSNGYRLDSLIEMARLRSFAAGDLGEEITLSDDELKSYLAACGTNYKGKVYVISPEAKERIKELAMAYFSEGAQAIFFDEFYAKHEKWLFRSNVVSEDMLIGIMRRLFPKLLFTQAYFGYTDTSILVVLESEILRIWGCDMLFTYDQLAERLPYIPLNRIKSMLSQNGNFIWNSVATFSHISRIEIADEEREAIRDAVVLGCNARGYVSITDLPFGEIVARNYELSVTALHNAVYRICLSDKFDKRGKIITRKGDVFDTLTIMKEYCRTVDKCTLEDLLNYEKELTGEVHRWAPMEAGNTILVRIDKENYVADRYVHFNTDLIDEAIELAVKGDYLPLKSFTTFGAFPDCGQTWNLFMLESYCRRFSRKFRFDTPSVNSRNAGAVIRKSCDMDYTEIMTDAVANADVPLNDIAVGSFLFDSGYTGRRTNAKITEIIDKAKTIHERRG